MGVDPDSIFIDENVYVSSKLIHIGINPIRHILS
jgi:hypothetical protein